MYLPELERARTDPRARLKRMNAETKEALKELDATYKPPEAKVDAKTDDEAGEVPIAFVVAASGADLSDAALIAHCESCLATYKRPVEFRRVDAIPKSASGKILRRVLKAELTG